MNHLKNVSIPLPVTVDDVDARFLTEALSINYPGVEVTSARHEGILWGTGTKIKLRVEYNAAGQKAGLPPSLFVKGGFSEHRELMQQCYIDEVRFYRDILPKLGINAPTAYFAGDDRDRKQHIVIMEDLDLRKVHFCRVQHPLNFAQTAAHLDIIARYQAQWWDGDIFRPGGELADLAVWEPLTRDRSFGAYGWSRLVPEVWAGIMKLPRAIAIPKFMHDRDRMERALVQLTDFCHEGPQCFLHGDYHLGNLYFDADGTAGTMDWQSFRRGAWSHDMTYFMVSALDIADRRKWDRALIAYYLERLSAHGVANPPGFDEAYDAFRRQVIDGLFYWTVNPVEFQIEENNCAVGPRFAMAALDHDTFELMGNP